MGVLRKLGIVILVYIIVGVIWSALIQFGIIPPAGGLGGALNVLYIIFMPVSFVYFIILGSFGLL